MTQSERDNGALAEATALLERWYVARYVPHQGGRRADRVRDTRAFLARAPAQPAAPEPSADTENPDYCRGYTDGLNDGVREILAGKERDDRLAAAVADVTKILDRHARTEYAEAQLAAVREVIETPWHDAQRVAYERIADALTPAPSPGADPGRSGK